MKRRKAIKRKKARIQSGHGSKLRASEIVQKRRSPRKLRRLPCNFVKSCAPVAVRNGL